MDEESRHKREEAERRAKRKVRDILRPLAGICIVLTSISKRNETKPNQTKTKKHRLPSLALGPKLSVKKNVSVKSTRNASLHDRTKASLPANATREASLLPRRLHRVPRPHIFKISSRSEHRDFRLNSASGMHHRVLRSVPALSVIPWMESS